jgi:truncated hemoglobin YjbI
MPEVESNKTLVCNDSISNPSLLCKDNSSKSLVCPKKPRISKRLSFSIEGDGKATTPLYTKIGEKCLVTLAEILYDLVIEDGLFVPMLSNSDFPLNPNMIYHFVLHVTARKPYDVEKIREGHGKVGFKDKHFHQLILLLGKAMGMMGVKEDVMREILQAAMATKKDFKSQEPKSNVVFW